MGKKKKNTDGENDNNKKKDDTPTAVVLKVDMHCEGCASKFIRCLRAFQGVETVKAECDTGKLTVTGKVDPTKVRDKLAEKMKKKVELISPQPKKEKENKEKDTKPDNKSEKKTDDKKPKEPPVTMAVLKVALHCQGCVDRIRKTVLKTKGVHDMSIDREKETVTVTGTMDVKALVGNLVERHRKVEVVPPNKDKDKNKEGGGDKEGGGGKKKNKGGGGGDNNGNDEEGGGKMEQSRMEYLAPPFGFGYGYGNIGGYNYGPVYPENLHLHLHAPQMFSDENPNACSVM